MSVQGALAPAQSSGSPPRGPAPPGAPPDGPPFQGALAEHWARTATAEGQQQNRLTRVPAGAHSAAHGCNAGRKPGVTVSGCSSGIDAGVAAATLPASIAPPPVDATDASASTTTLGITEASTSDAIGGALSGLLAGSSTFGRRIQDSGANNCSASLGKLDSGQSPSTAGPAAVVVAEQTSTLLAGSPYASGTPSAVSLLNAGQAVSDQSFASGSFAADHAIEPGASSTPAFVKAAGTPMPTPATASSVLPASTGFEANGSLAQPSGLAASTGPDVGHVAVVPAGSGLPGSPGGGSPAVPSSVSAAQEGLLGSDATTSSVEAAGAGATSLANSLSASSPTPGGTPPPSSIVSGAESSRSGAGGAGQQGEDRPGASAGSRAIVAPTTASSLTAQVSMSQAFGETISSTSVSPSVTTTALAQPLVAGASMQEMVDAVRATVELAVRQGSMQARIALQPEELGGIRIHLSQTSEGLLARLVGDTPAAAQALADGHAELHRSLSTLGLPLLRMEIGSYDQSDARPRDGDRFASRSDGSPGGARQSAVPGEDSQAISELDRAPRASALAGGGLVDVLA